MTLGAEASVSPANLRGFTRFITKTTSAKFSDADIDALLNLYYHEFVNEIIKAGGDIDFNIEEEDMNLTAGTSVYSITGKVLALKRIQITYDGTNYYTAKLLYLGERKNPMDSTSINADFSNTNPYVLYYLDDEVMKFQLLPPHVSTGSTVSDGIKVWKILEITELSDAAHEPSIPEAYQKYLCFGASISYYMKKELWKKLVFARNEMAEILQKAIEHYSVKSPRENYQMSDAYNDDFGK